MPLCICPNCQARYNIPLEKLGPNGRTLRCAKCGQEFFAPANGTPEAAPAPATLASTAEQPANVPLAPEREAAQEEKLSSFATLHHRPLWLQRATSSSTLWILASLLVFTALVAVSIWNLLKPSHDATQDVTPAPVSATLPDDAISPPDLVLSSLSRGLVQKGQTWVLTISGTVSNVSKKPQIVPEIRVQLLDGDNVPLDFWPAEVATRTLQPQASTAWQARFLNPDLARIATYRAFFRDPTGLLAPKKDAKKGEGAAEPALDDTPTTH